MPKDDILKGAPPGELVSEKSGRLIVPDRPLIGFIPGDGIGPEVMSAALRVWNAAVERAFGGRRKIAWKELYAGNAAQEKFGEALPEETLREIKRCRVAVKGPLSTPVGSGMRSLNVALRRELDLYACVRPVRHFKGAAAPALHPEKVDVVIFRENTEDLYAGLEWPAGAPETLRLIKLLNEEYGASLGDDAALGIKPISESKSKRLIRRAIRYALDHGRDSVTLVHKGNIMKYTEGGFREWGYELAREEFPDAVVPEAEYNEKGGGAALAGKIILQDRIADNMFQQLLLNPGGYDVIASPNLNGDYLSDACAAQVGGLGLAPGANIGDEAALFEATHGAAPDITGNNIANPCSLILSGCMMLNYLGWDEAAASTVAALESCVKEGRVTADLAPPDKKEKALTTSAFADEAISRIRKLT